MEAQKVLRDTVIRLEVGERPFCPSSRSPSPSPALTHPSLSLFLSLFPQPPCNGPQSVLLYEEGEIQGVAEVGWTRVKACKL